MKTKQSKSQITFKEWASLMNEAYKGNNNGKWATIYAVMAAFKMDLFDINVYQTAPYFKGPSGSGKTEIAFSTAAIFGEKRRWAFDLSCFTDTAMLSHITKKTDIPFILNQYADESCSEVKFKALKIAAKGYGKIQKYMDASLGSMDIKVKRPIIIASSSLPERDNYSLFKHIVVLQMPAPSYRTHNESQAFYRLKMYEGAGLQHVHSEIKKEKDAMLVNYIDVLEDVFRDMRPHLISHIDQYGYHYTQSHSFRLFLGMCKLIEDHTKLKLPFTYKEFLEIALKELKDQPNKEKSAV